MNRGNVSDRAIASDFMKLPPKKRYPDYYVTIKHPIALDTILSRIEKEEYEDILALKADLTLMTSNAKKYNEKGSSIYEDATTIQVPPHSTFLSHLFLPSLTVSELSINTRMKSNSH